MSRGLRAPLRIAGKPAKGSVMGKEKKKAVNPEQVMLALDQIGQTVEVMNAVVRRLRNYMLQDLEQDREPAPKQDPFFTELERKEQSLH